MLADFVINDTATTKIYTYVHTLSLHDALPIYHHRQARDSRSTAARNRPRRIAAPCRRAPHARPATTRRGTTKARRFRESRRGADHPRESAGRARSEEHTSELQSLMRNSYAVLCLKKKTYSTN